MSTGSELLSMVQIVRTNQRVRRLDCGILSLVRVSCPPVRLIQTYFILRYRLVDVEVEGLVPVVNSSLESLSLETRHLAALAQVC